MPEIELTRWFLAMLRPGGILLAAPLFSMNGFPMMLRIILALALAGFTRDYYLAIPVNDMAMPGWIALSLREILAGLMIGFLLQTGFSAAMLAGETIANMMGLGFAASTDPVAGQNTAVLSQFFSLLLMLVFLTADGHLMLFEALSASFAAIPVSMDGIPADKFGAMINFGGYVFAQGILLAFPVGLFLFAVNLVLATLSRLAPQLNLFAIGMPFTLFVGSIILFLALPLLGSLLGDIVRTSFEEISRLLMAQKP